MITTNIQKLLDIYIYIYVEYNNKATTCYGPQLHFSRALTQKMFLT